MKRTVFIEAWRNHYDGEHWLAEVRDSNHPNEFDNPVGWYQSPTWEYKYSFSGKKANVLFVSRETFSRDEALAIALLIVEGKGVKAWRIELQ